MVKQANQVNTNENREDQLVLDGIKRPRGRPKTGKAKSAAERQRQYRQRKARADKVELRRYVTEKSAFNLETLERKGLTLDEVIEIAMTARFGPSPK